MKYASIEKGESASIKACTHAVVAALIIGMVGSGPVNAETGTSVGNTSREKNTGSDRGAKGFLQRNRTEPSAGRQKVPKKAWEQ